MPWLLFRELPPPLHGRGAGGDVLLCPGGPDTAPGHGGRSPFALPSTGPGVGVACGVGRGVGFDVGATVGLGVGRRIGGCVRFGGVAVGPAGVGTGVGPPATIGPSDGDADGSDDGSADGSVDGSVDGTLEPAGSDDEPAGSLDVGPGAELGEIEPPDVDGAMAGLALAAATPPGGVEGADGATMPAVRATVARMRFKSPIATTRRARCAVVTVWVGLLPAGC